MTQFIVKLGSVGDDLAQPPRQSESQWRMCLMGKGHCRILKPIPGFCQLQTVRGMEALISDVTGSWGSNRKSGREGEGHSRVMASTVAAHQRQDKQ